MAGRTGDTAGAGSQRYAILYGDIHNHNAHGYGVGSIERSLDIARRHLDFFAFTGHSSWHDMPSDGGRARAPLDRRLQAPQGDLAARAAGDRRGQPRRRVLRLSRLRVAFLAVGRSVRRLSAGSPAAVLRRRASTTLRRFCLEERALMIPHHLAYPTGNRGVNWEVFREDCTPVVEIYLGARQFRARPRPVRLFHALDGRARHDEHRARGARRRAALRLRRLLGRPRRLSRRLRRRPDGGAGHRLHARRHLRGDPRAAHLCADRRPHRARVHASTARRWARASRPRAASRRRFASQAATSSTWSR